MCFPKLGILATGFVFSSLCFAQPAPPPPPPPLEGQPNLSIVTSDKIAGAVNIVSGQFSFEAKVVKGQPYSADSVTEVTQVLADGNHIRRKETASVARDSDGRTRREQVLSGVGPWATSSSSSSQKIIFINDPVAQVNYVLGPDHTARRMPSPPAGGGDQFFYSRTRIAEPAALAVHSGAFAATVAGPATLATAVPDSKTEQLGTQLVEGVQAEGTRTTVTIAAGQIGNELPIEIVSERWYSPELQVVVMTKSSDPRMGETVHRLTNIQRSEPPVSSFEVPSDYKIEDVKDAKIRLDVRDKEKD